MSAKKPRIGNNPLDWIKPTIEENDKGNTETTGQELPAAVPVTDVAVKEALLSESYKAREEEIRPYYFIPVSAKSEESLYQKYRDLLEWLKNEGGRYSFADIAYTMLIGRSHFFIRSAFIVTGTAQLENKLKEVLETGKTDGFFTRNPEEMLPKPNAATKEKGNGILKELADNKEKAKDPGYYMQKIESIADIYVKGYDLNWSSLYSGGSYRRIPMPTYPFAINRYWVNNEENTGTGREIIGTNREGLHPLIDFNSSTLEEQYFSKIFTGDEFYLKDHVVGKDKILPGVAYIEMARAAGKLANPGEDVAVIRDISWQSPIKLTSKDTSFMIKISIYPCGDTVEFKVSSNRTDNQEVVHSTGRIDFKKQDIQNEKPVAANIEEVKGRCTKKVLGSECYGVFLERGLNLGRSFQAVKEMYCGEKEVISLIELPGHLNDGFSLYDLHPSLMDGALETVIGLMSTQESQSKMLALPFEMGSVEIYGELPKRFYSYAKEIEDTNTEKNVRHYNVDILDESGNIVVMMKGFGIRPFFQFEKPVSTGQKLHYHITWEESGTYEKLVDSKSESNLLIFTGNELNIDVVKGCYEKTTGNKCKINLVIPGTKYKVVDAHTYEIDPSNPKDYTHLLEELHARENFPTDIIHTWSYLEGSTGEQLKNGYYAVFNLSRALAKHKTWNKLHFIYVYPVNGKEVLPVHAAMGGFSRTARIENSKWIYKTLGIQSVLEVESMLETTFKELSSRHDEDVEVIAEDGKRTVKRLKEFDINSMASKEASFKEGGVYLITGGTGGLGLIFAKHISQNVKGAKIILSGRSQLEGKKLQLIKKLENNQAEVLYIKSDVADRESVEKLACDIGQRFGKLDGIIHGAGVIKDSYVYKKTHEEIKEVLAPKIYGTLNLDEVFKNENLKFFVLFSSIAALTGNAGQCDYSYANSFMDYFAKYREGLVAQGKRKGKVLSINWSLWQEGGMQVDDSTRALFADTMGIKPLGTEIGLNAFEKGLSTNLTQILVIEGEKKKLDYILGQTAKEKMSQVQAGVDNEELLKKIQESLVGIVSKILKIQENDIHFDREMSEFGFNSLSFTDFSNEVNKSYDTRTTPAIFFEYPTLRSFSQHLFDEYKDNFIKYYYSSMDAKIETEIEVEVQEEFPGDKPVEEERPSRMRFWDNSPVNSHGYDSSARSSEPVAIIGMSGVMPLSEDLDEFWRKIEAGCDLISEIPKERWDWEKVDSQANMQVSRWGGFMKEVDKFDALFFGISPREADLMDPQQRILLETVWKTIEDAGYKPSDLSGSKTGLFVGVTTMDYVDVERDNNIPVEAYTTTGASHCILANRVSFILNLHGPSMPLDTACSSSLIAIHQAVESIRNGDSEMAIAGGVNVLLSSPVFLSFTKAGMLSPDGRCKTFDKSANGYVRGEGCGSILMKPLSKALADGDNIHAVIKGSAVNHGGRANSLTAPNPNAQAELLVKAYERAGISPDTISYIEAHGTGTNLGDPVEVNGLKMAFKELYKKNNMKQIKENYCGLCSVKTNVGHLESAAGIVGILKVLLSMKYKKIPGNVHLKEVNPYIDLKESPFYIVNETREWESLKDHKGIDIPRRAGVSSFGFGGANSHIVLEEYIKPVKKTKPVENQPVLVVLSAKNADCLGKSAEKLKKFLEDNDSTKRELDLIDIAYTLQVGREAMEERLAIVAGSRDEIIARLSDYLNNKYRPKRLFYGNVEQGGKLPVLGMDGDDREYLNTLIRKHKLEKIARLWVEGVKIDWELLYQGEKPFRVSLPTYPFERVRHWVSDESYYESQSSQYGLQRVLHPMIDSNESTLDEEKFKKTFGVHEFYLKDHVVEGEIILPGVAYLEIARAAGEIAVQKTVCSLKDVIWAKPVKVDKEGKDIYIEIYPGKELVEYEIYSLEYGQRQVHSQGTFAFNPQTRAPRRYDINEIKNRCTGKKNKEECYQKVFKAVGFDYGHTFQVTHEAFIGNGEGLARLELPKSALENFKDFVLHPSLMDGAVRAVTWTGENLTDQYTSLRVPFALGELEIFGAPTKVCYAYASVSGESGKNGVTKYDVVLLDELGEELVCIKDFSVREYKNTESTQNLNKKQELLYYAPYWEMIPGEFKSTSKQKEKDDYLIIFEPAAINGTTGKYSTDFNHGYKKIVTVVKGKEFSKISDTCYSVNPANREDYTRLFKELAGEDIKPSRIIHLWNMDSHEVDWYSNTGASEQQEHLKDGIYEGLCSILYLFQEISGLKLDRVVKCIFGFNGIEDSNPQLAAVYGLAKTIAFSSSRFELATMEMCDNIPDRVMEMANAEVSMNSSINGMEIRISNGKRFVRKMKHKDNTKSMPVTLKKQGVYLITGGNGALGMIMAEYLSRKYSAKLVLMGRRSQDRALVEKLNKLKNYGGEAIYYQGNIGIFEDAENAVKAARDTYGKIDGVFHCAGIWDSTNIFKATAESFEKALIPKLYGTVNLDLATSDDDLDIFIMFSSITGETGDLGAGSYAAANCYMDRFSKMREKLRDQNKRKGRSISINWPFWTDGGFELPKDLLEYYVESSGMREIDSKTGLQAFEDILEMDNPQVVVAYGDPVKITKVFDSPGVAALDTTDQEEPKLAPVGGDDALYAGVQKYLKEMFAKTTKIPINQIGSKTEFEKFGIDSILIMELNKQLEKDLGTLPRTLFFEYNNIEDLVGYFVKNHQGKIKSIIGVEEQGDTKEIHVQAPVVKTGSVLPSTTLKTRFMHLNKKSTGVPIRNEAYNEDIAIIGMSGRYPGADNLDEFWENLKDGKDCITEIPQDRWDYTLEFDPERGKEGKYYCKHGGFINDVDKFDAQFFNMSPRDAQGSDPQERLFLETVQHTIEDAGYKRSDFSKDKVGVYVGVMYGQYNLFGVEETLKGNPMALNSLYASIANRVSYYFNFTGPSVAMDSMCSSSLTTLHLACESLYKGESDMAIAGGINLTIHPDKYRFLCSAGFISSDGRCRSYGEGGDGYVPGEGVGAVLLKPLTKAIKDNDHIYAVVKATAINHNGRTNGYSVPSPNAQAALMTESFAKSGIDPRSISYIEGHGTGTALGDAIEIVAFSKVFEEYTNHKQFCPIGSVKSNVGHLESAAGIVALTKVLLQMKNKQIVPSIHSNILNSNINFKNSPFYVQHELSEWERPVTEEGGMKKIHPRRAGVSSFGAGGSNGYVIMEEFEGKKKKKPVQRGTKNVFVLSAKSNEVLYTYAKKFLTFLEKQFSKDEGSLELLWTKVEKNLIGIISGILMVDSTEINITEEFEEYGLGWKGISAFTEAVNQKYGLLLPALPGAKTLKDFVQYMVDMHPDVLEEYHNSIPGVDDENKTGQDGIDFEDLMYTMQVGREELEERLAVVASSLEELKETLEMYCCKEDSIKNLYTGSTHGNKSKGVMSAEHEDSESKNIILSGDMEQIAKLWVSGYNLDWQLLYISSNPCRIPLPVYPFKRERYWAPDRKTGIYKQFENLSLPAAGIHPLIDANESTFDEQCFSKLLEQNDSLLDGISIFGRKMLPMMAFIEMARAAGNLSNKVKSVMVVKNIRWSKPDIEIKEGSRLYINLCPGNGNGIADYEVCLKSKDVPSGRILNQGCLEYGSGFEVQVQNKDFDIEGIKDSCSNLMDTVNFYNILEKYELNYSKAFCPIKELRGSSEEMLALLEIDESIKYRKDMFLHPVLMEGMVQAVLSFLYGINGYAGVYLPYSIKELKIIKPFPTMCYAYIQRTKKVKENCFDVKLFDTNKNLLADIREFRMKCLKQ